jgi:multidrug efflux pump subunit AcrA (membrane-fusion protein)
MSKTFSVSPRLLAVSSKPQGAPEPEDPRVLVRAALGVLVVANIAAALIVFKPWGGSAEDLARQQIDLQQQLTSITARLAQTKALVDQGRTARAQRRRRLPGPVHHRPPHHVLHHHRGTGARVSTEAGIQPRPASYELESG